MIPLYTNQQVREVDKYAINEASFPSTLLMENAALGIAGEIENKLHHLNLSGPVSFLCGKGNNGGDGFAAARHLANKNYKINILSFGSKEELSKDALTNFTILQKAYPEVYIRQYETVKDLKILNGSSIIVDCMLGSGTKGSLGDPFAAVIDEVIKIKCYKIAVDIPTGLNADTGYGDKIFKADLTITLAGYKIGLFVNDGYAYSGEVIKHSIGIKESIFDVFEVDNYLIEPEDVLYALPQKARNINKYTAGKVLNIAGSDKMPGAALISTFGVLKSGAGASVLAFPQAAKSHIMPSVHEVIVESYGSSKGFLTSSDIASLEERIQWADVVSIGPGLGRANETVEAIHTVFENFPDKKYVLDADALFALKDKAYSDFRLTESILTPHLGEFSRLLGLTTEEIKKDVLAYGKKFALQTGSVLVLKGAPTIIFTPDGEALINTTGNAGMAKFGTGDALTGIIAGLYSQNLSAESAAICGVYLHSLAADLLMEEMTEYSFTAMDIINNYPKAVKFLRNSVV